MPLDRAPAGTLNLSTGKRPARDVVKWMASALAGLPPMAQPVPEAAPQDDGWTPQLVGEQLLEAMRWVRRTAPAGPRGMVTAALPTVSLTLDDFLAEGWGLPEVADDDEPERELVLPPSAKQVSRHMAALQWPADYLCPQHVGSARMVGLWAACRAYRRPFSKAIEGRGISRPAAYQLRDKGLSLISQGLTRDRVPVDL